MKNIKWLLAAMFIGLIISNILLIKSNHNKDKQISIDAINIKAYDSQLSGLTNDNRIFKLTIDQVNYFNDSILKKMNTARKELGIKDNQILQMQYQLSNIEKADSVVLLDTIFIKDFELDTIIGDQWASNHLILKYPNYIKSTPRFKSESYVFVEAKKETVNPPKKFFLLRWFQKKHTVATVDVLERSPYIEIKQKRFIQIIKD